MLILITYIIIIAFHFTVRLLLNFENEKPKTEKYFNNIWGHLNENIENTRPLFNIKKIFGKTCGGFLSE